MPKTGYVAIVGRPNAGKSTLLNALIGEKVSAVSHRPQTTQRSIPGIYTDEEKSLQIIFLDTPGIHSHAGEQYGSQKVIDIHERINSEAYASLHSADVILRLLDPTRAYGEEDARIDALIEKIGKPIIRVETKQDLIRGEDEKIKHEKSMQIARGKWQIQDGDLVMNRVEPEREIYHDSIDLQIDSVARTGFEALLERIGDLLPEGPYLYSSDYYTDQPMHLRIQEVIRECLFLELGDEIPYACYVEISSIEEKSAGSRKQSLESSVEKSKVVNTPHPHSIGLSDYLTIGLSDYPTTLLSIMAYINVESESQKVIVIGKGGAKIQKIGMNARIMLEEIFEKKVFLALRVKVHKNWRKDQKVLEKIFPRR